MAPNARPVTLVINDDNVKDALTEMLDAQADTDGLSKVSADKEDWSDVKHSERKKRDRILDDGVLIGLMKKSDYQGWKRLGINLSVMAMTAYAVNEMDVRPFADQPLSKLALFIPLYLFYGFQFQCFAFAGQHEFLHRNAWKTKAINDWALFFVGLFCFELGEHERVMHKAHHTFTNHIEKDPELTSVYSKEVLENPGFRNLPLGRIAYFRQFLDIFSTFWHRVGRIVNSARGIPVDYSGWRWSLKDWTYSEDSGILQKLQRTALMQLTFYIACGYAASQSQKVAENLLFWWIAPVLLGYPVVNYFRNLEHANCEVSKVSNCLRNTRSVRSNIIIRTLLWDTNFHAEHHCYPMVPFFNLHKINELMYEHVINNDKDHFTLQNWAAVKPNGWIAAQTERMEKMKPKAE